MPRKVCNNMNIDDKDVENHDIPLKLLRDEDSDLEKIPEEENRRQILIYSILAVIAFALCCLSFIVGVKMGRSLERKTLLIQEENFQTSVFEDVKPVSHPENKSSENGSQEFMILQNAKKKSSQKKKKSVKPKSINQEIKAPTSAKKENTGKFYTIQITASENKEMAEKVRADWVAKGYDAFISTVKVKDKTFYRVRVGKFETKAIALQKASEIKTKEKLNKDFWVTLY